MTGTNLYELLKEAFVATFLDELIPGIFHNLANPLNGIMGRSKLMQRRMAQFVGKLEKRYPDIENEMGADYKKLTSDIDAINTESERFYDMFRVSTAKFYAIDALGAEKLNLSALLDAEMAFADFYLEFKHNISKEVHLDRTVPDISGITAYHSLALWMLIRQAMMNIKDLSTEAFSLSTSHDHQWVVLKIAPIGSQMMQGWRDVHTPAGQKATALAAGGDEQKSLQSALLLLQQASKGIKIEQDGDRLTIRFPYHA